MIRKQEIELALQAEQQEVSAGLLKEDNPLDLSSEFHVLCEACRRGDLKVCHQKISEGVNINARDSFDYTPLILV
jgi:ankyrin repeat protein